MTAPQSPCMEAVSSCNSSIGDCNRDMERLLEAFGSSFSLETILSAYSQASRNVDLAGGILYELQETTAVTCESKDDKDTTSTSSLDLSSDDPLKHTYDAEAKGKSLTQNICVSGISGGEHFNSSTLTNGSSRLKSYEVHSNESLTASCSNAGKDVSIHADIEDFLLRMLGDGFQLDMKMVREVLGLCGYDLEKSMDTLVDLSASTLEKSDDVVTRSTKKEMDQKIGSVYEKSQTGSSLSNDGLVKKNGKVSRKKSNDKHDLQKEILGAIFSAPERVEELPAKLTTRTMRRKLYGRTVVEPVKETKIEQTFVAVKPLAENTEVEEEEDENSFPVLRQAVKENWATMKEYYKAATDAYTKGDQVRANKLMKEGQFYNRKAREADEKSAKKLLETREEEMLLDISTLEPKEAIKLLKFYLSKFAGIPSLCFLKVIVGDGEGENKKGCLKRLVPKLLEKKSIKWTEADNGNIIVIRLDELDPKSLSQSKELEVH